MLASEMAKTRSKELKVGRGVSLAEAKWEQLAEVAEAQDRSPSQVIDEALTQYFAKYERAAGPGAYS